MSSSPTQIAPPRLLVKSEENTDLSPLPISECSIEINILGNFAQTKICLKFYNGTDRILEGQFIFPLLQGQSVSGYSLEIDGKFRDAVVVEKAMGRKIFESTIRQKIDPGLLELTRGNVFQSRIYPIPAKGYKSIIISFEEELNLKENGWLYLFPLQFHDVIDEFSLQVYIRNQTIKPLLYQNELDDLEFQKIENSFTANVISKKFTPNKQIGFLIPKEDNHKKLLIKTIGGKNYFHINLIPEIKLRSRKLPAKVCLLWDASGSGKSRDLQKEIAVLQEYFERINNLTLEIVLFSFWVHSSKEFVIQNGNTLNAIQYLKDIQYDGGTQLGALDLSKYNCDEFILVSDGISNFGEPELKLMQTPLYVINSSVSAEHSYLEYISKVTNGIYLNLAKLTIVDCIKKLTNQIYSFLSLAFSETGRGEVYPSLPTNISKDISFSGFFEGDNIDLILNFGYGREVISQEKIRIDAKENQDKDSFIERIFAIKKISELDLCYKKNKKEITQIGKEFSIVTRNTSLLVLDRIEDYVQYKIIPPDEMQEEYFELVKKQEEEKFVKEKNHLDQVAEKFQVQIDWWNKDFKPEKKESPKKRSSNRDDFLLAGTAAPEELLLESLSEGLPSESQDSDENLQNNSFSEEESADFSMNDEPSPEVKAISGEEQLSAKGSIVLKKWNPAETYLKKLKDAPDNETYSVYLLEKQSNANSSAFFLDVADFFLEKNQVEIALRVLSNIAEMNLENHQLLRILGYRLLQIRQWKFAIKIFEEVLELREEEPQSYRDLALACLADSQFQRALDLFYSVIKTEWDIRFPDIQLIAIHEMNAMIANCKTDLNLEAIDKRFLKNLPVDIRVILTWDADNTDLDLWVTDPNEEKCYYGQNETSIGGRMSQDFREGYGPEEFLLKKAIPGNYLIQANYFGSSQQVLSGTTTIQVTLTKNFGRINQEEESITMRLKDIKEVVNVGEFKIE